MNKPFGGGMQRTVRISSELGKVRTVKARLNIFGSRLAVFEKGKLAGKIGVPHWANQLAHATLSQAIDRRRGFRYSHKILLYQVYPDLYSALRRTMHILYGNYGRSFKTRGEKSDLNAALGMLQRVNGYYLSLRTGNLDQYHSRIQSQVEALIHKFGTRFQDERKKEARNLMVLVGDVYDSLDRINPSAKLTQLVAIRNRLEERVADILHIEPRIMAQRQSLLSIIELCELRFKLLENFLDRLEPHLTSEYFSSHGGADLQKRVACRLQSLAGDIACIDIRPFLIPGQHIDAEVEKAAKLIINGKFNTARRLIKRSHESLRLRVLRTDMENLITRLTRLLFAPQRRLPVAEIERIKKGFRIIRARLATIDESGFRRPVCKHALSLVSEAEQPIKHLVVAQNSVLKPVKEKLVQAARLL
jgi:hypothetical protein